MSTTQTYQTQTLTCKLCTGPITVPLPHGRVAIRLPGLVCNKCLAEVEARQKRLAAQAAQRERQAALERIAADPITAMAQVGVPVVLRAATFDAAVDLPMALLEPCIRWAQRPAGMLFLSGAVGAGKSYVAACVVRAILQTGVLPLTACRWVSERQYLSDQKAAFTQQAASVNPGALAHPIRTPLLICDDLASSRLTDWVRDEISGLLDGRYGRGLPTVLTSNLSLSEIAQAIDTRVASRISESRENIITFPPADLRECGSVRYQPFATAGTSNGEAD